jgi:signal peptidase I
MASNLTTDKVTKGERKQQPKPTPQRSHAYSTVTAIQRILRRHLPSRKGLQKTVWREYFESAVVTVIMALFGMTFIVQAVKVPTGSMQNTISIGDHLLVNKFIFAPGASLPFLPQREIRRGDIIVFKYPGNPYDPRRDDRPDNKPILTNYVKRVIGLPGDRISLEGKNVIVNGQALPEHRIDAIDHNRKDPLEIVNTPARKPNETYDVYYRPGDDEDDVNRL